MLNQRAKNNRSFFYKFLNHNINLYFATKSLHQITLKLGQILEVTRQSISNWESDHAFPETQKLIELSKLYHCTVDYLLGNEILDNQISSANHKATKKHLK